MCSWRPSESLLIYPCLLSPWPPDSHYSVVCVCALVCVGQWLHCGGSPTKMCRVVNPSDSNTHTNAHMLSHFCPQQPWLPRPWMRRDWRDKSMKLFPFLPLQKTLTQTLHTCKKSRVRSQFYSAIILQVTPSTQIHTHTLLCWCFSVWICKGNRDTECAWHLIEPHCCVLLT